MNSSPKVICPPPRSNWACNRCRKTKSRCLPSSKPSCCERCVLRGHICSYPQHKEGIERRRRARKSSRDARLSSDDPADECENSIASLGYQPRNSIASVLSSFSAGSADDVYTHHRHIFDRLFTKQGGSGSLHIARDLSSMPDSDLAIDDVASSTTHILSDSEIYTYLWRYQSLQHYFPFLPLPEGWSVENMKSSHPFFFLGILAAMTQHQFFLNRRIHRQFIKVLAERVIVRAEKSLDLVQGMLTQLSRFPLHLDPKKGARRMFQVLRLAVSMIEELRFADSQEQSWLDATSDGLRLNEQRLAHLACSCISSIASVSFQCPNCAQLTDVFIRGTPSVIFLSNHSRPSDGLIYLQASLLRVAEEANAFRRENHLDAATIYMNLECLRAEVQQIVGSVTQDAEARHGVPLQLSMHYAKSQINAIVFGRSGLPAWSNDVDFHGWILSAMQDCLYGMREFLETFASLPIPEYRDLSFVQWAQFVQVLKLIPTLCFNNHKVAGWNTTQVRKEMRMGMILESLCFRMYEINSEHETQQSAHARTASERPPDFSTSRPDWFLMFKSVLKILKETYDRRCTEAEQDEQTQQLDLGCPVLSGKLQESEFWAAFEHSTAMNIPFSDPELIDVDLNNSAYEQAYNNCEWDNLTVFDNGQM